MENVYASGVLIYLSQSWVSELYYQVTKDSFLQRAGYATQSQQNWALINILTGS